MFNFKFEKKHAIFALIAVIFSASIFLINESIPKKNSTEFIGTVKAIGEGKLVMNGVFKVDGVIENKEAVEVVVLIRPETKIIKEVVQYPKILRDGKSHRLTAADLVLTGEASSLEQMTKDNIGQRFVKATAEKNIYGNRRFTASEIRYNTFRY